jgi:hypothetical protein
MLNEKLRRYGATLSTAAALGGLAAAPAEAKPLGAQRSDSKAQIEAVKLPQNVPKGVHAIVDSHEQRLEAQYAVEHLTKRLDNVVLVLHAPKKNAYVEFATSPSSYIAENDKLDVLGPKTNQVVISPNPGIVKLKSTGREYATVYDTMTSRWAFLDIDFAKEMGALDVYTIKGKTPRLKSISMEQSNIPYIFGSIDYGAEWIYGKDNRAERLLGMYLPTNTDPHRKYYHLAPANAIPNN